MPLRIASKEPAHPQPSVPPASSMVDAYRLAAAALGDMQRHRVRPTAEAYELWLAYHANNNPALTRRMSNILREGQPVSTGAIEALHDDLVAEGGALGDRSVPENYIEASDALQHAAEALVQHVADGRDAIHQYGEVLAQSAAQLGQQSEAAEGLHVVQVLTAETVKMAEHNRNLRDQLAATSAKVDKLRQLLADEKQAANTDQLTGLSNRRAFNARLRRALVGVKEGAFSASLLILDIDHFKRFNDAYGHSTGDLVLRLVSRLLIESIKGRDIAARYGGEEFAVLLVGAKLDAAAHVARQLCTSLEHKPLKIATATEHGQCRVTMSVGVAQLRAGDSSDTAVDRADAALYAAKHAGRNRVMTEQDAPPQG